METGKSRLYLPEESEGGGVGGRLACKKSLQLILSWLAVRVAEDTTGLASAAAVDFHHLLLQIQ